MNITGRTKLYGIIADPIGHVRAPMLFNALFAERGVDAVMVPFHVKPENLKAWADGLRATENFGGIVITVPHKLEIAKLCDELGTAGRLIGAINALRRDPDGRLVGDMFDGKGFVAGMRHQGFEVTGKRVLLLGAGGAARAIAFELAAEGVERLTIQNRTPAKAEELAAAVKAAYPKVDARAGSDDPAGHDTIVNSTSLGLKPGDALPMDVSRLTPDMLVAEIIMDPVETALLQAAKQRGCPVHYGRHMLDQQILLLADFLHVGK